MKDTGFPHSGLLHLGALTVPFAAEQQPKRLDQGSVIISGSRISVLHPFDDTDFYRHGWNSWSPTGWRRLSAPPLRVSGDPARLLTADDAATDTPMAHSGSAVGALQGPNGDILLLGSLGIGSPRVGANHDALWGRCDRHVDWYLAYGNEAQVFADYAEQVALRLGARTREPGRVWSSWYSFYDAISHDSVRAVLAQLQGLPFDVVQLDDGWERSVGDWEPNRKFPAGMRATADEIRGAGFHAGIWLAPLVVLPSSRMAQEQPHLLVRDPSGAPAVAGYNWGGPYFALDTTQPEVQDHLRRIFERVVDWGFSYLKLDFMYAGAIEGTRAAQLHREVAYREALALIRETVGDDVYILGCGVPMLPSAGILDGARVGPDVAAFWDNLERRDDPTGPGAKNALVTSVHRTWLRRLYQLDPDVVYFRRRRSLLDEAQRQAIEDLATVLGFKSTSDPIDWLDPSEVEAMRSWLSRSEPVRQIGRYRFELGDRTVDLEPFIDGSDMSWSTTVN